MPAKSAKIKAPRFCLVPLPDFPDVNLNTFKAVQNLFCFLRGSTLCAVSWFQPCKSLFLQCSRLSSRQSAPAYTMIWHLCNLETQFYAAHYNPQLQTLSDTKVMLESWTHPQKLAIQHAVNKHNHSRFGTDLPTQWLQKFIP